MNKNFFKSRIFEVFFPILILLISSFFAFYKLGEPSLNNWDEGIYANIVQEMGSTPTFSVTYLGNVWLEKPIFGFWGHWLGTQLFGLNNFGLRAIGSIFFIGSVLVLYFLLKKFYSSILSFIISLAFLFCPLFYFPHMIRTGDLDMYFLFFTIFSFYIYVLSWEKPKLFWVSGLVAGLAFMTRGYIAAIIPIVIFLHWLCFKGSEAGKKLKAWQFILSYLLVIAPWHLYAIIAYPKDFLESYFGYHFLGRISSSLEGHVGGFWFYFNFILSKLSYFFPIFLGSIIFILIKLFHKIRKEDLLWFLWFLVFFISLQLMQTKIVWYIIGMIPAMFALVAATFHCLFRKFKNQNTNQSTVFLVTTFLLVFFYFSIYFNNSFYYVFRPVITPVDTLERYLGERQAKPELIVVYSSQDELHGPAFEFQLVKKKGYQMIFLNQLSDVLKVLNEQKNFLIITEYESYQALKEGLSSIKNQKKIRILDYYRTYWGDRDVPLVVDIQP